MASTPASSHFIANLLLDTTCATFMPRSWNHWVYFFGLPAEVNTIGTCSSSIIFRTESISGYMRGMFTPQGLSVAAFVLHICSRSVSGCMEPAPRSPRPPALLTADANRHPLHHTMPPAIIGCSIPNSLQILLLSISVIM